MEASPPLGGLGSRRRGHPAAGGGAESVVVDVMTKRGAKARRATLDRLAFAVIADLNRLRTNIDALGELSQNDRADMLACFASNTLYGTQALVEQIKFVVAHPKAKRAVWP
jgi:hypothetical protein